MATKSGILIYGDLIDSREISSKSDLTKRISQLEVHFSDDTSKGNFSIWKGLDEFMLIATCWKSAISYILLIQETLHPFQYRYEVMPVNDIEKNKPIHELTNPEFAVLSERMSRLKETDMLINIGEGNDSKILESAGLALNLLLLRKGEFTANQMQQYRLHKKGMKQNEIASELKVTQQSVSKTLNQIQFKNIETIENRLLKLFNDGAN